MIAADWTARGVARNQPTKLAAIERWVSFGTAGRAVACKEGAGGNLG
jgi:cytochrome bd-type quinol oxidase subunit 1